MRYKSRILATALILIPGLGAAECGDYTGAGWLRDWKKNRLQAESFMRAVWSETPSYCPALFPGWELKGEEVKRFIQENPSLRKEQASRVIELALLICPRR